MQRLPRGFYARDTRVVARELLGKLILSQVGRTLLVVRIVETEAYHGPSDGASHARRGLTPRTTIMFGEPGRAYIYLIYGVWNCLNLVTGEVGFPSAVLVRAGQVEGSDDARAASGPGKLCRALGLDRKQNGEDLVDGTRLWVAEDGFRPRKIARGPRVNVDNAGRWAEKPWRFWIADHPSVSRK
jgi:DNA-3-methyladenine glycosylase